jgi:hypothetical protein
MFRARDVDEVLLDVRRRTKRQRKEENCSETCVASVVVVVSLMSRRRCPTPMSSASSASMDDSHVGVFCVFLCHPLGTEVTNAYMNVSVSGESVLDAMHAHL